MLRNFRFPYFEVRDFLFWIGLLFLILKFAIFDFEFVLVFVKDFCWFDCICGEVSDRFCCELRFFFNFLLKIQVMCNLHIFSDGSSFPYLCFVFFCLLNWWKMEFGIIFCLCEFYVDKFGCVIVCVCFIDLNKNCGTDAGSN